MKTLSLARLRAILSTSPRASSSVSGAGARGQGVGRGAGQAPGGRGPPLGPAHLEVGGREPHRALAARRHADAGRRPLAGRWLLTRWLLTRWLLTERSRIAQQRVADRGRGVDRL